jgi:hypothetical protein
LLLYIKTTFYVRQDLPAFGSRSVAKKEMVISLSKRGGAMNPRTA